MLILEKPYVSPTLINTAIEHNLPVLKNDFSVRLVNDGFKLNLLSDSDFVAEYDKRGRLYTMSENALGWIYDNIKDQNLLQKISLLKDKATFRRLCQKIYPDFFFIEEEIEKLSSLDTSTLKFPLVLKPSVGFLSAGVYVVKDENEWKSAICDIQNNFFTVRSQFPEHVIGTKKFLVEEYIHGEEYAVDTYFDNNGNPTILNIFHHRFANESDTSDRLYCSSKAIYDKYEQPFRDFLIQINETLKLANFPMHIEFRYDGKIAIPIEINPLRFAGFCLNELQTHISGIHPVLAYLNNNKIEKEEMWQGKEDDIYSFLVLERPNDAKSEEKFNEQKFRNDFMDVLELRPLRDPAAGVAATAFIRTDKNHLSELDYVLNLDMHDYMTK